MSPPKDALDRAQKFRRLSDAERALLCRLFSAQFGGRDALVAQLDGAEVRTIDTDGSLEFKPTGGPLSEVTRRVPVEAEFEDEDGVTVHVLLHVVKGLIDELEVFREDSKSLLAPPLPERLRLIVL